MSFLPFHDGELYLYFLGVLLQGFIFVLQYLFFFLFPLFLCIRQLLLLFFFLVHFNQFMSSILYVSVNMYVIMCIYVEVSIILKNRYLEWSYPVIQAKDKENCRVFDQDRRFSIFFLNCFVLSPNVQL